MSTLIIDFYAYVCYSGFKLDEKTKTKQNKNKNGVRGNDLEGGFGVVIAYF